MPDERKDIDDWEDKKPKFDDTDSYIEVTSFSAVMNMRSMENLINWEMGLAPRVWFKQSKRNLYSMFEIGHVPAEAIANYGLQKQHLHQDDHRTIANAQQLLKERAQRAAAKKAAMEKKRQARGQ